MFSQPSAPPAPWISEKLWLEMLRLSDLPAFAGKPEDGEKPEDGATKASEGAVVEPFRACFARDPSAWRHVYDSASPETEPLPEP